MIISHRGKKNGFPENTIPAFEKALKSGAQGIECDIRLTLDHQVVLSHEGKLDINDRKLKISKTPLKELNNVNRKEKLVTSNELFDYINQKKIPFFLEVKTKSAILVEEIATEIKDRNLWDYVHIMGFSIFIKNALAAQEKYPKLKVLPIVTNPFYSYVRRPKKSYGLFLGWIDQWHGSQWLFRKSLSKKRLIRLKNFYEKRGLKVMAGVINNDSGFEYFKQAGVEDIVTDNINGAVKYFKKAKD